MELTPGTAVTPNVRLVRRLREGGMGTVWVGEHLGLETRVAVKFISPELATREPTLVARFKREAKAAAQISSPHVVRIFDFGVIENDTPYMVMELLEGNSLREWLELDGPLSPRKTALIVAHTGKALAAAHALGIVHRDIKPDNLFLLESEYEVFVKVLDFGIAKQAKVPKARAVTSTGMLVGTPEYMSPEQLFSSKDVDYQADLWALSVVAYETLTGRVPFSAETVAALGAVVERAEFALPSTLRKGLPPKLDQWFQRALSRRPEDRFGSARELATTFLRLVECSEVRDLDIDEESTRPEWDSLLDSDGPTQPYARVGQLYRRKDLETGTTLPSGAAPAVDQRAASASSRSADSDERRRPPRDGERHAIVMDRGAPLSIADDETAAAAGSTLASAASSWLRSAARGKRRRRARIAVLGAVAVLAVGVTTVMLSGNDQANQNGGVAAEETLESRTTMASTATPSSEGSAEAEPSAPSAATPAPEDRSAARELDEPSVRTAATTPPPAKPTAPAGRAPPHPPRPTGAKPGRAKPAKPAYCKDDPYILKQDGTLDIKPECI